MQEQPEPRRRDCPTCAGVVEFSDGPHIVRTCDDCGRTLRVRSPGERGRGIRIGKGDQLATPLDWMTLSFNPLKSRGQFTKHGINWFAKHAFVDGWLGARESLDDASETLRQRMYTVANESPVLSALDDSASPESPEVQQALDEIRDSREFWAYCTAVLLTVATAARGEGDAELTAWATAGAERCRMMLLFKEELEVPIMMAQSARRLLDVIQIWDANRENASESFWQSVFDEHAYVLAQVFAVPVVFIGERTYVGGTKIDGGDAKFVDFLFAAEASRETLLVEIKTPATKLLGREYRKGTFGPSAELGGSSVQILRYREELSRNVQQLTAGTNVDLRAFSPRCVIVAGNASVQLGTDERRKSFELFRASTQVEIVTYDELFRKVEILAELFRLKRPPAE